MAAIEYLDSAAVRRWLRNAMAALTDAESALNSLNVFPVPDNDTGTNLRKTVRSAVSAVESLPAGTDPAAYPAGAWRALTQGAVRGAAGSSGVILSQYMGGLAKVCSAAAECDGGVLRQALNRGAADARAAVARPVEGTILSAADAAAAGAAGSCDDLLAVITAATSSAFATAGSLTAAQLTVDAGAAGLCVFLDALRTTVANEAPGRYELPAWMQPPPKPQVERGPLSTPQYEVAYLLEATETAVVALRAHVGAADDLIVGGGPDRWNVHIHTPEPARAIRLGWRAGTVTGIAINDLPPPL
jgi:dihydroxyacetone kinase-like predicted kinase